MKNTSQIHHKGGKKNSFSQGAIPTDKPSAKTPRLIGSRPKFLAKAWLIDSHQGEDLWADSKSIWIVPHPYQGNGERRISYDEACVWLSKWWHYSKPEIRLAEKFVFSGIPERKEQELKWHGAAEKWLSGKGFELAGVAAGIGYSELSEEQLLDSICESIVEHEEALKSCAEKTSLRHRSFSVVIAHDVFVAARAVVSRSRWHGLKERRVARDGEAVPGRAPLFLDLPGMAGRRPFNDGELLENVCSFVFSIQQLIVDSILPQLSVRRAFDLAQSLMFVEEYQECCAGCDTGLHNLRTGERSPLQQIVEQYRVQLCL
ncbi:MAG: hypothetical protein U1F65_05165 [Verrucomicrobiota bacterium]